MTVLFEIELGALIRTDVRYQRVVQLFAIFEASYDDDFILIQFAHAVSFSCQIFV